VKRYLIIGSLCLSLGACVSNDDAAYPSLAPRPIEKLANEPPTPVTVPLKAPDAALVQRVAGIEKQLSTAAAGLNQAIAQAPATRASRLTRGSDAWTEAQIAASRLEAAVGALRTVQGDIADVRLKLAQAASTGTDTGALMQQLAPLAERADSLVAQGQAEIDRRR